MEKEFNLSEKIRPIEETDFGYGLNVDDVKEFIRRLKEEATFVTEWVKLSELIDKLAGEKLK